MDAAVEPLIAAVSAFGEVAQRTGVLAAALLAAGALLLAAPRARAAATLGALVLTPVLLLAHIGSSEGLAALRDRPVVAGAAALAGLLAVAGLALVVHRRPALLALAAAAALPFRVPIEAGASTAALLVPLYLVVGAGALAYAVPLLLRGRRPRSEGSGWEVEPEQERAPGLLEWLLAGAVVLYAAQAAYSSDFDRALQQVVFFYVPFALLFALLARLAWTRRLATQVLGVFALLAGIFVVAGFYEYATRTLLLAPGGDAATGLASYFRVQSLFFDPNIYGRFLVVVMLAVAAAVLWSRRTRSAAFGALVLLVLWAGLVLTFSQSSFTALLAGLALLGALRWGTRRALVVVAVFAVAGVGLVLLASDALRVDVGDRSSLNAATSGRADLLRGGVELFAERPLQGWGAGAFRREYRAAELASSEQATAASHTMPLTVAAEQGVAGLALYLALLAAALARLLRGARGAVARAAVGAAFVALVVHTMLYAAFLEDPLAWALLGAGTGLARRAP